MKTRLPKLVTVLQPGDTLMLDVGYGLHEIMEQCTIVNVFWAKSLWSSGNELCALVRDSGGSTFSTTLIKQ